MPITRMDLGGMEAMQATVNMDPWLDKAIAIAAPLLLVLITLPVTITRAALLGLDCVVLRSGRPPARPLVYQTSPRFLLPL